MATSAFRISKLQDQLRQQRALVDNHQAQLAGHQAVLDIQFRRFADMQAELDLVKATVRLAAPTLAAALIGEANPFRAPDGNGAWFVHKPAARRSVRAKRGTHTPPLSSSPC